MKKSTADLLLGLTLVLLLGSRKGSRVKKRILTQEQIALLGTASDVEIAEKIGMTKSFIAKRRKNLGIPPFVVPPKVWTEQELDLIGTMSDIKVANILGLPKSRVRKKRLELGRLTPDLKTRSRTRKVWTDDMISLLGTASDVDVADVHGMSDDTVRLKRRELGIQSITHDPNYKREYKREGMVDWTDIIDLLGTASDTDIADLLGVVPSVVGKKRLELGIPMYSRFPDANRIWTEKQVSLLGKNSDGEIAQELGISIHFVSKKRNELGIPSVRDRNKRFKDEEILVEQLRKRQARTIDLSLNPDILQGQEFRTKENVLLKGKQAIPSDAGSLPRYVGGKRWLSPGTRDRGGNQ